MRSGIDAVENLVLSDAACNGDKGDLLPGAHLVSAWAGRNSAHQAQLAELAVGNRWETDPTGVHAVARSIYRHLPAGVAAVWLGRGRVGQADPAAALAALMAAA